MRIDTSLLVLASACVAGAIFVPTTARAQSGVLTASSDASHLECAVPQSCEPATPMCSEGSCSLELGGQTYCTIRPNFVAVCCSTSMDCPVAGAMTGTCSDPVVLPVTSETVKICLYPHVPYCTGGAPPDGAHVERCFTSGGRLQESWALGDCDQDGQNNMIDLEPCNPATEDGGVADAGGGTEEPMVTPRGAGGCSASRATTPSLGLVLGGVALLLLTARRRRPA